MIRTEEIIIDGKPFQITSDDEYLDIIGDVFDPELCAVFSTLLKPDDMVLDVGANIGLTALYFGKNAQQVYAVEPSRESYKYLQRNVSSSGLDNIELYNVGLGAREEKAPLTTLPINRSAGFVSNQTQAGSNYDVETINIKKGDQLFKEKKIDLIKIDVEGFEMEVIEGLEKTIQRNQPIVVVEVNHWCLNAHQRTSIPEYFDFLTQKFPILYAIEDQTYADLRDPGQRYHAMHEHIVRFKFMNAVGAFHKDQLNRFLARYSSVDH